MLGITVLLLALPILALADGRFPRRGPTPETLKFSSSPAQSCKLTFQRSGVAFDLCPHFAAYGSRGNLTWTRRTPPSETTTEYKWSLGGMLERDGTVMRQNQCPSGTWVCLTVTNVLITHRSDPPRIAQLVPIAGSLAASKTHDEHKGHEDEDEILHNTDVSAEATYYEEYWNTKDVLTIRLHGGSYVQQPQHALFVFRCDPDADFAEPKYVYNWNGTHIFGWRSKHACPTRLSGGGSGGGKGGDKGGKNDPERPPPDDVDGDGKGEGPDVDPIPGRPKASLKSIVTWAGLALIGVIAAFVLRGPVLRVAHKHAPRLARSVQRVMDKHPLAPLFKRFTFRAGERTLVRWVREEGAYTGVPGDGEGPVFEYDADGDEEGRWLEDEMIPLTPSPGPRSAEFGAKAYPKETKGYGAA